MRKLLSMAVLLLVFAAALGSGCIGSSSEETREEGDTYTASTVSLFDADTLHVIVTPDIEYSHAAVIRYANGSVLYILAVPDEDYVSVEDGKVYIDDDWISLSTVEERDGAFYWDVSFRESDDGFSIATSDGSVSYHVENGNWDETPDVGDAQQFYNYLVGIFDRALSSEATVYDIEYSYSDGELISLDDLSAQNVGRGDVEMMADEFITDDYYYFYIGDSTGYEGMDGYYMKGSIAPVLVGFAMGLADNDANGNSYVLAVPVEYKDAITLHTDENGKIDGIYVDINTVPEGTHAYVAYMENGEFS
ncbi:hypothetical protein [Thermococcus aciditolerans]|uniref:Uncharacterized protein n=1 Tax=Thermococcus aciditolerans TaxID=2598455 RepID=A0A5C0SMD9_9EURY|nr:hypothetical protein [Thermococcus aciditolerans]QEK15561.1 hypothetical protein FPV09_11275 [Thermococcus aciditolerans]